MRGLIFDFDGVIADSEALAHTVLAELVSGLGRKTSLDDALTRYMGKRWPEVLQRIEEDCRRCFANRLCRTPEDIDTRAVSH
jgi:beta-phosphoglucomutase-like phosphatase (HAD superfamily)